MGTQGVVVPGETSKADAVTTVTFSKYSPWGNRSACSCIRAGGRMAWNWHPYKQCAKME